MDDAASSAFDPKIAQMSGQMTAGPNTAWRLSPIELSDRPALSRYFNRLSEPLSDYTFSQIFTWRNSLRLLWREIDDHLCVFANGAGDLTLLIPPIAADSEGTGSDRALRHAFELMDDYNASHGVGDHSRIEYVSQELLARFDQRGLSAQPMGHDYVYETARMIDLAGGDLKSKRQERNRFTRDNQFRVETFTAERHLLPCLELLNAWKDHQDQSHADEDPISSIKRTKETTATQLALQNAAALGLSGMVVYVDDSLRAFTFGEPLGSDQASIVIEKTDLASRGLAQFVFSEFCRRNWADRPLINAGDDWGMESLKWTKASYRPVKLLQKYVLRKQPVVSSATGFEISPVTAPTVVVREATADDLAAAMLLEKTCFDTFCLSRRQLRYLQRSANAVFQVADDGGAIVGEGIALLRHHKRSVSGRLYSLAVRSDYRGKGVGDRLLKTTLAQLVSRGAKRIFLEVEQANTAAVKLYERNGFRSIGVLSDYYGNSRHGVHMVCELLVPTLSTIKSAA